MTPDVEAVFVNRSEHGNEVFLLPIDECYALVGELRRRWQGFDGGAEAHAALAAFLAACAAGPGRSHPRSAPMADLVFGCTGASAERYAATPTLSFAVTITESTGVPVHAIALRCQIRIEPQRRRYSAAEAKRLHDLFGDTSRWADTVKPIQLAIVTTMVPAFSALTEIEVQMPCTYDLEVASARYLQALDDGTVPLLLLFSGTVFLAQGNGYSVELVPWSSEASFRMPVSVWQEWSTCTSPAARGCGAAARRSTPCPPSSASAPCRPGTRPSARCWRRPRRAARPTRRRSPRTEVTSEP